MQYKLAAMGGTFDHFHKGHKELIKYALDKAEKVIIGVTDESLILDKEFVFNIEDYWKRVRAVEEYIRSLSRAADCKIVKLNDGCGPTLGQEKVDCLVCSPLTKKGADLINQTRQERGLKNLPIEICQMQMADDNEYISSTRIRKGEINREGLVYRQLFINDIEISERTRQYCKNPLGKLIKNPGPVEINLILNKNGFNVVVGDFSGKFFLINGIRIRTIIFDGRNMRQEFYSELANEKGIESINSAGQINSDLARKIETAFWTNKNIKVSGEEDLAVIPAILLLPLGTKIFYGQPNEGLVMVEVAEEIKQDFVDLIKSDSNR